MTKYCYYNSMLRLRSCHFTRWTRPPAGRFTRGASERRKDDRPDHYIVSVKSGDYIIYVITYNMKLR